MRSKFCKIAQAVGVSLALVFTFSCTLDDGGGKGNDNCPSNGFGGDKGNDIANYRTEQIGTQVWMAENLNYAVEGSKCYGECGVSWDYDENSLYKALSKAEIQAICDKYGRIYGWATAMALPASCNSNSCSGQIQPKHRGICPAGWHIPNKEDWGELLRYVDDSTGTSNPWTSSTAGRYLKATSGWNDYNEKSGNGEDKYGFSALPGGYGHFNGTGNFYNVGSHSYWWSARESDKRFAAVWNMSYNDNAVDYWDDLKSSLRSIRCVQD